MHIRRWCRETGASSTGYNKSPIKHKCAGKNPQAPKKNKVKMVCFPCLFSLVNGFLIPLSALLVNAGPAPGALRAGVAQLPANAAHGTRVDAGPVGRWDSLAHTGPTIHIFQGARENRTASQDVSSCPCALSANSGSKRGLSRDVEERTWRRGSLPWRTSGTRKPRAHPQTRRPGRSSGPSSPQTEPGSPRRPRG